jgi:hypothetical protein
MSVDCSNVGKATRVVADCRPVRPILEKRHVGERSRPSIGWRRKLFRLSSLAVLAMVCGCAAVPSANPPRPPRTEVTVARPRPEPRVRTTTWQFVVRPGACIASASDGGSRFGVSVEATGVGFLLASTPPGRAPRVAETTTLSFSGPEGEWRLGAERRMNGPVTTQLGLDEPAAVHVLALIGGGTVSAERGGANIQTLRLPPGGAEGRAWFECVRRMLSA